ncbi:MAG: hypothetical protein ACWA41_11460 [Putridiphycobacter sp.]
MSKIGQLSLFIFVFSVGFVSCKKSKTGVWEEKINHANPASYHCSPDGRTDNYSSTEAVYHEDASCKDLGYTDKDWGLDGKYFVSPDGVKTPGENGAFWDEFLASGGGSSSSSSSGGCSSDDYNGPEFDTQVDSQCKTAHLYDCQGMTSERDAACDLYYSWESSWTGSGSFPDCPYCP